MTCVTLHHRWHHDAGAHVEVVWIHWGLVWQGLLAAQAFFEDSQTSDSSCLKPGLKHQVKHYINMCVGTGQTCTWSSIGGMTPTNLRFKVVLGTICVECFSDANSNPQPSASMLFKKAPPPSIVVLILPKPNHRDEKITEIDELPLSTKATSFDELHAT
eukprot:TRINITY_DN6254_c0_g1_i6.p1 TRINITY_DN6254_c0_g1~~TRINITY_DN6254_c0_g1_i6.p1  ORF type:complete len:159 (+),score=16.05 TRINITY_DN6254_c0_g1_i6:604-1080(+)